MPVFLKQISIPNDGVLIFGFTKMHTVDGTRYFVSVVDKQLKHIKFYMRQTPNGWQLVNLPPVPQWLIEIEGELNKAILSHF